MNIEDFLKMSIEEYLFKDLQNLSTIQVPKGDVGNASYPMLSSILAGMELLGIIVCPNNPIRKTKDKSEIDGGTHFTHFWTYYLSRYDKKYIGFNKLFYDLLRNGIVHTFMVKQHIIVYKSNSKHMCCSQTPPQLIVGCNELFEDFKQTYYQHVLPILTNENSITHVNRSKMQSNLDAVLDLYSEEADSQFKNLNLPKHTHTFITPLAIRSGASLSPIDITELSDGFSGTVIPSGILYNPKK